MRKGLSAMWRGVGWLDTARAVLGMAIVAILLPFAAIYFVITLVLDASSWWVALLELLGIAVVGVWAMIVTWHLLVRRDDDAPAT